MMSVAARKCLQSMVRSYQTTSGNACVLMIREIKSKPEKMFEGCRTF